MKHLNRLFIAAIAGLTALTAAASLEEAARQMASFRSLMSSGQEIAAYAAISWPDDIRLRKLAICRAASSSEAAAVRAVRPAMAAMKSRLRCFMICV